MSVRAVRMGKRKSTKVTATSLRGIKDPRERFIARLFDRTLKQGWREADDLFELFPPASFMVALEGNRHLRVKILTDAVGIPKKIATRRSVVAACEDVQLAVEEGITNAEALLEILPLSIVVGTLDINRLWIFSVEGDWVARASRSSSARKVAVERIQLIIESAVAEGLVSMQDIARGISFEQMAQQVSIEQLQDVFVHAMNAACEDGQLDSAALLGMVDVDTLLADIPLEHTWTNVVMDLVASAGEFPQSPDDLAALPKPTIYRRHASVWPASEDVEDDAMEVTDDELDLSGDAEAETSADWVQSLAAQSGTGVSEPTSVESTRRRSVTKKLEEMGRLPPSHEYLSLAILRSMVKAYDEMKRRRTKASRARGVRECFDNDAHLKSALLALLELLNPALDVDDASDTSFLVDVFVREEYTLWKQSKNGGGGSSNGSSDRRSLHVGPHPPPLPLGGR